MIDISEIQTFISQHGHFNILDWLLEKNWLTYADYEQWRYGSISNLEECFAVDREELNALCNELHSHCEKLKLVSEVKSLFLWGSNSPKALVISSDKFINESILLVWRSPKDVPQMDLFMDNTPTILENQVIEALADRRFREARDALEQLATLNQAHLRLGAMTDLINYGDHIQSEPLIALEALSAEFDGLDCEVAPLAKEVLGSRQRDFLAFAWRRVADSFFAHPIKSSQAEQCCYALAQIPDWQKLKELLDTQVALYQSPVLLQSLASAYAHTRQDALYKLAWGILFERFPEQAYEKLNAAGRTINELWESFTEKMEDSPDTHFLGFLLIQQPGLVQWFDKLPASDCDSVTEPENRAILELVKIRLLEQDERNARALAKEVAPDLFKLYLNKRDWQASLKQV